MQLWFKSIFPIFSPSLSRSFFTTSCRGVQMKVVVRGDRGREANSATTGALCGSRRCELGFLEWIFPPTSDVNGLEFEEYIYIIYIYVMSYIYIFICVELNLSIVQEWNDYIRLDHEIRLDQIKCQLWMNHDLYKPWLMFFSGLLPKQWWLCQAGHKSLGVASQSPVARGLSSGNHHVHSHEIGTCLVYLIL